MSDIITDADIIKALIREGLVPPECQDVTIERTTASGEISISYSIVNLERLERAFLKVGMTMLAQKRL